MIRSAALLFRENGYSGTSFRDVIAHSGAPRGSIYHHCADGKEQLAADTAEWAALWSNDG
jgi:AcrR family transcriptional regulator